MIASPKHLLLAACICAASSAAFAAGSLQKDVLTIDEARRFALTDNQSVLLTRSSLASREEKIAAAKRAGWPALDLEVDVLRGHGQPTSFSAIYNMNDPVAPPVEVQEGNYGYARLTLSAPLYEDGAFFFQDRATTKAAKAEYTRAEANHQLQQVMAAAQTAKAYMTAVAASESVKMRQQAVERLQKRVRYVENRVAAGIDGQGDALLAKATLTEQATALNTEKRNASMQLLQLSFALGLPAPEDFSLVPISDDPPPVPEVQGLVRRALIDQPVLRMQTAAVKNAQAERASTKAKAMPAVSFMATMQSASDLNFGDSYAQFDTVGVKLTMPLLDFSKYSEVKASSYAVAEAETTLNVTRNLITQSIYSAYYNYTGSLDQIVTSEKQLELLEYQLKTSTARYEQRLTGLDSLLKDEAAALEQRVKVVQNTYAAWSAYADLLQALGYRFDADTLLESQ